MIVGAHLSYLRDTLFGPIAHSIDCDVIITFISAETFQVQVLSPVTKDLHKAHALNMTLSSGEHLNGRVVHVHAKDNKRVVLQVDT